VGHGKERVRESSEEARNEERKKRKSSCELCAQSLSYTRICYVLVVVMLESETRRI
jgi:hypothetical protein